jgi:hypothetical protein
MSKKKIDNYEVVVFLEGVSRMVDVKCITFTFTKQLMESAGVSAGSALSFKLSGDLLSFSYFGDGIKSIPRAYPAVRIRHRTALTYSLRVSELRFPELFKFNFQRASQRLKFEIIDDSIVMDLSLLKKSVQPLPFQNKLEIVPPPVKIGFGRLNEK